jgi:PEGA domain
MSAALLAGCVERRYVITSDPPGAVVYKNGQPLGATPVDDHFVYYGKYDFVLIKEGYETLAVEQEIPTPWYEVFPLDFISENLIAWPITDVRRFHYRLEPRRQVQTDKLLQDAGALRARGQSIGTPVPLPPRPPD